MNTIKREGLVLPVTKSLCNYLLTLIKPEHQTDQENKGSKSITINFRDPDYSAESGGYHPVEISMFRQGDEWQLRYITGFSYVGVGHCAELVKDTDFDFEQGTFQSKIGIYPLDTVTEFYSIWEANFLAYSMEMEVFNISITTED